MTDLSHLVEPHRVHRRIYVDPEIFEAEMDKIFGGTWVFLAHESQIAEPNDFITTRLGRRPLILTRDGDGELHALLNRCAHRASTVCQDECGNTRNFQCSYHGWTYSNRGDLVNVPFPRGLPGRFRQERPPPLPGPAAGHLPRPGLRDDERRFPQPRRVAGPPPARSSTASSIGHRPGTSRSATASG